MTINNIENLESGASVRGKLNNVISEVNSLGTAANADIGDFATSAQGTLADTAVQPSDLSTVATTNNYNDLDNLPSLGSISTQNSDNVTITGGSITGTAITGNLTGNASTATALQTARTIGGVSFDGTANIDLAGVNIGGNQNTTGSAASLTTERTLTIGSTGKTFNGTADVSWSLSEIGVGTLGQQDSNSVTITGGTATFTDLTVTGIGEFTSTGAVKVPVGTEAQRPTPAAGQLRFNNDTTQFEGYNGTAWGSIGGGATGGGNDDVFVQNGQVVTTDYTIPADKNAMTTGPIEINAGVTVTVSTGSRWVVL